MFALNMENEVANEKLENHFVKVQSKKKFLTSKKEILERYQSLFEGFKVNSFTSTPSLITHSELVKLIENIYEDQMKKLLQSKTKKNLDLIKMTRLTFKKLYKNDEKTFLQKLLNFLYSIEKYSQQKEEILLYLKFLCMPKPNHQYLFYLYLREHFKIVTLTNFRHFQHANQSPLKLTLKHNQGLDIIKRGFYDDSYFLNALTNKFKENFSKVKIIKFYDFMNTMTQLKIEFRNMELMANLLALYVIKKKEDIRQFESERQIQEERVEMNNFDDQQEVEVQQQDIQVDQDEVRNTLIEIRRSIAVREIQQSIKSILDKNKRIPVKTNQRLFEYLYIHKDKKIPRDQVLEIIKQLDQINQDLDTDQIEQQQEEKPSFKRVVKSIIKQQKKRKQTMTPFERILDKKKIELTEEEHELHIDIQDELKLFVKKLVYNFIEQNDILVINLKNISTLTINKIYKKLYFLCLAIFMKSKNSFFKLLRQDDEEAEEFWDSMGNLYERLKNDNNLISEFLHSLFQNEQVSDQLMFYLNFQFEHADMMKYGQVENFDTDAIPEEDEEVENEQNNQNKIIYQSINFFLQICFYGQFEIVQLRFFNIRKLNKKQQNH